MIEERGRAGGVLETGCVGTGNQYEIGEREGEGGRKSEEHSVTHSSLSLLSLQ